MKSFGFVRYALLGAIAAVGPSLSADRIVPSAAHAAGRNGALFRTDLRLLNTSRTETVRAMLVFLPASGGAPSTSAEILVLPLQQRSYDDVLAGLFGVTGDASGPIRLVAPESVELSSRTYNVFDPCTGGTFGTWIPGLRPESAMREGLIPQVSGSASPASGSRTNLIVTNPSASVAARVTVTLKSGSGAVLGTWTPSPVEPNGSVQGDVFLAAGAGGVTTDDAFVQFSSDQPVLVLSTVIDNRTNDAAAFGALALAAAPTLVKTGDQASFTGSYGVSGHAVVANENLIRLDAFRANGTAPGLDLRIGHAGNPRAQFTILRSIGRQAFNGADLELPIPPGLDLNSFDTFTVWCYEFNVVIAEGKFHP
ncbi:MAG: DM13 domain-containing protein [Thermoanaerobaculia bacterium]